MYKNIILAMIIYLQFLRFLPDEFYQNVLPGKDCSSHVGNLVPANESIGRQAILLKFEAYRGWGGCGPAYATAIHEICHFLGTFSIQLIINPIGTNTKGLKSNT